MQINITTLVTSLIVFVTLVCVAVPIASVHAQGNGVISGSTSGIQNPLGGGQDQTITSVLTGIIKWMLGLVGFLALIALIIGGGRMVLDFGNEEQVHKAKKTILWAVIGLLVVILSYAIVNIVSTEILGGGSGNAQPPAGT